MAGRASTLGGPARIADYLSMRLLARQIPPERVMRRSSSMQRHRDLPAHAAAHYVMAMSLYRDVNTQEVLRIVSEGMGHLGYPGTV